MSKSEEPVAVVDLGTNSCLLLVGRRGAEGLEVLLDRSEVPRMGEGLDRTGRVGPPALERLRTVLAGYLEEARALGASGIKVGGTAALRRATNQAEVLAALAGPGIELEVIDEEREARMGWLAAAPATGVLDVGGGSTEVALDGGRAWASAPVGATVLVERVADAGSGKFTELVEEARRVLAAAYKDLAVSGTEGWVALGGTPTNLASLCMGLSGFDHLAVEGTVCTASDAARWGAELAERSLEDRLELPIEASRARVLHGGMAILVAAMEHLGLFEVRVTGRGLRYGYLSECLDLR